MKYTMVGMILISTLIIATGMYMYSSSQSTISDSLTDMSIQEVQAFNLNFTLYEGKQTGSQVKALIQRLIANANTYLEEPDKIPSVKYVTSEDDNSDAKDWQESDDGGKVTSKESDSEWQENYVAALAKLSNCMEPKHTYYVEVNVGDKGIVDEIIIYYDRDEE